MNREYVGHTLRRYLFGLLRGLARSTTNKTATRRLDGLLEDLDHFDLPPRFLRRFRSLVMQVLASVSYRLDVEAGVYATAAVRSSVQGVAPSAPGQTAPAGLPVSPLLSGASVSCTSARPELHAVTAVREGRGALGCSCSVCVQPGISPLAFWRRLEGGPYIIDIGPPDEYDDDEYRDKYWGAVFWGAAV